MEIFFPQKFFLQFMQLLLVLNLFTQDFFPIHFQRLLLLPFLSKRLLWENAQKHENGRMYRFDYSFVARIEKLKSRKYLASTYIMLVFLQYIYQLSTHRHKIWILSCAFMQTMSQRSKVHGDGALFDSDVYQKLKRRSPPGNFI